MKDERQVEKAKFLALKKVGKYWSMSFLKPEGKSGLKFELLPMC
jgi:hypothetical protein